MAETHKKGFNAQLVMEDLIECCRNDAVCGACQGKACVIGYAKHCIEEFLKQPRKEVPNGVEQIPTMDFKLFDETALETAIAHILKECKDCKEDHTDDCIINVIRNCQEVGLFGDIQPYEGSALQYLMYLQMHFPEKCAHITAFYRN